MDDLRYHGIIIPYNTFTSGLEFSFPIESRSGLTPKTTPLMKVLHFYTSTRLTPGFAAAPYSYRNNLFTFGYQMYARRCFQLNQLALKW